MPAVLPTDESADGSLSGEGPPIVPGGSLLFMVKGAFTQPERCTFSPVYMHFSDRLQADFAVTKIH